MIDGGYPSTTEPNQLKAMITPPSLAQKLLDSVTGKFAVTDRLHESLSRMPWRDANISYLNNEIYFDIIEKVDCIVSPNEMMLLCEVFGDIRCTSKLSGMPDLTLTLTKPGMIDDVSLHRCVRINKYKVVCVFNECLCEYLLFL